MFRFSRLCVIVLMIAALSHQGATGADPTSIVVGLDADMTSGSARSGVAIQSGAEIAVDKVDTRGVVITQIH